MRGLSWVLLGHCREAVLALVWVRARTTLMPTRALVNASC